MDLLCTHLVEIPRAVVDFLGLEASTDAPAALTTLYAETLAEAGWLPGP